jgi:hypothetical protein
VAILAAVPSQLPTGFSRILVLTPTFTPHPTDAARLERANIFVVTGALTPEFKLPPTSFDVIPAQMQGAISGSDPNKAPVGRRVRTDLKSWTQPDLDAAIRKYKADRAAAYRDIADGVKAGQPGAKKAAQKMFGRNVVADTLGVKARAMVTKSPEWQAIAEELHLPRGKDRNQKTTKKVGLDIAIEQQASETAHSGLDIVVQNETIRFIRKSIPRAEAEPLIEKLERGEITDDQAREIVSMTKDQKRDQRSRKVPGNP